MLKFALMLAGTSPYLHLKPHLPPLLLFLLLSLQIFASAPSDPDAAAHRILLRRSAIKQRLSSLASNTDKLAALKDSYSGRTLTPSPKRCPSLSHVQRSAIPRARALLMKLFSFFVRRNLLHRGVRPIPRKHVFPPPARCSRWRRCVRGQAGELNTTSVPFTLRIISRLIGRRAAGRRC